ncbi:universal stress protein [Simiduia curdlanivorans]|uniref:Universal stress protein n=1 Tax=Simiduia curdlanivorans TaxID=1492769 RepID=A0ABV8V8M6_9GAMM|nr:universal stress protein [Simiduia curdlanivorans]MDN3639818.1 universal stress protein [Simiduia curdlanivorans]
MIEKIVCGTDLGPHASYLIYHAVYLARQCGAKVEVVHAVEPLGSFAKAVFKTYSGADNQQAHQAIDKILASIKDQVIESLADEYMSGLDDLSTICDVVVDQGMPAEVILRHAKESQADLIVIGGQSTRGEGIALLGSVAAKILQLSKVPVLTIPLAHKVTMEESREDSQLGLW